LAIEDNVLQLLVMDAMTMAGLSLRMLGVPLELLE
jgi:hypothetical protein